jgi:hypothetical protein
LHVEQRTLYVETAFDSSPLGCRRVY